MKYKTLSRKGANLNLDELGNYLEKMASDHILQNESSIYTYPIPKLRENFEFIFKVYNLLNEHIKIGIPIHPAGEWLLDNFYIIEETQKNIIKQLTLKKYKNFLAIANGEYKGFARIYVLCSEIVAYTDYRINAKTVINLISSYQKKKNLSMEEIWNIGIFIQIALIQGIRDICEKIYLSQIQKYKVENIVERIVENKEDLKYKNLSEYKEKVKGYGEMKYPFIEYMSFTLKKYGKAGIAYINVLEEQVNKMGTTVDEVIKKEHFDIAVKRVSIANAITSIKEISRINFKEIFDKINGVEDILRKDPAKIYDNMDYRTKEYYRNTIKELAKKTKMSEIYIANCVLQLCEKNSDLGHISEKETSLIGKKGHVGYYLIDEGVNELYKKIEYKPKIMFKCNSRVNLYIFGIWGLASILDFIFTSLFYRQVTNIFAIIIFFILMLFPSYEIVNKITQYILRKSC